MADKPLVAITGASSGIGETSARVFSAAGYPVCCDGPPPRAAPPLRGGDGVVFGHDDRDAARRDPTSAAYPLRRFADEWGISPGAALVLSRASLDDDLEQMAFSGFRREASAIVVWETKSAFTFLVPRPLTSGARKPSRSGSKGSGPGVSSAYGASRQNVAGRQIPRWSKRCLGSTAGMRERSR